MKLHAIRTLAIATLFIGFLAPRGAVAQQRGPSTAEERAKAVKVAHQLEDDPLAKDAKEQREWIVQWIIDVPDITVDVCFDYFGKLPNPPRGHSEEITKQMIISSAAFMIEHPDQAKSAQLVALAGVLGALKAYQSILKKEPESRWEYMDMLLQLDEEAKLNIYVSEIREKCNSDEKEEKKDPHSMRTQLSKRVNLFS
jgi:hypothetical protein